MCVCVRVCVSHWYVCVCACMCVCVTVSVVGMMAGGGRGRCSHSYDVHGVCIAVTNVVLRGLQFHWWMLSQIVQHVCFM